MFMSDLPVVVVVEVVETAIKMPMPIAMPIPTMMMIPMGIPRLARGFPLEPANPCLGGA